MANTNFKYNIGDKVRVLYGSGIGGPRGEWWELGPVQKIIDHRVHFGELEYRLDCGNWRPECWLHTDADIASEEAKGTVMVDYEYSKQPDPKFTAETASANDALALDFPDPDEEDLKSLGLPMVNLNGVNIPVIEHFKDIKKYCSNSELFGRWYNRTQFLKYILGTFEDNGEETYSANEEGMFGTLLGSLSGDNSHDCWFIEIYDAEQFTASELRDLREEVGSYERGFFLKDKSGKIYFVFTDVD